MRKSHELANFNGHFCRLARRVLSASQSLRRLRDAGLPAQKVQGSATYYVPTERLLANGLSSNPPALSCIPEALRSEPSRKFDETMRSQ